MEFEDMYAKFYEELGSSKKMVLSTSLNNIVTSRMMSIVILNRKFYFQTDKSFRKYSQLKKNPYVALCIDNIQIEGCCKEIGHPSEHAEFSDVYKKYFFNSYMRYTPLENERLFVVTPTYIERWVYMNGVPCMETFDIANRKYDLNRYFED